MNPISIIIVLHPAQSVLCPSNVATASMTNTTPAGGLANDFTSLISFLLIVFKAETAYSKIGIAASNSSYASLVIS